MSPLEYVVLKNGNCLDVLRQMDSQMIHMCITDPPYFIDGMGDEWSDSKLRKRRSSASAKTSSVKGLPPVMPFSPEQGKRLYLSMLPICGELHRVLTPGAFVISFGSPRLIHRMALAFEDSGFEIRDQYVWSRPGQAKAASHCRFVGPMAKKLGLPAAVRKSLERDTKSWKTPQLKPEYEPMVVAQKPCDGTMLNNWYRWGVGFVNTTETVDGKFPGTIIDVPRDKRCEDNDHPTPKPVALIEHLVKLFSQRGQVVTDPFMGSGSHGEAAVRCGRGFVGIEIDPDYFQIAERRLEDIRR